MKLRPISILVFAATAALSIAAFPSSAHALTYSWDINFSVNNYQATGQISTDTNNPNYAFKSSDVTDFTINLTNGTTTHTLTPANTPAIAISTLGLTTDNTGSSLLLQTSSIPALLMLLGGSSSSSTIISSLPSGNIFASATSVPFDIPGGATILAVGSVLALAAMRCIRKSVASNTRIANPKSATVNAE